MLQSLMTLSDQDIDLVTDTVRQWCVKRKYDIDSIEGRYALTVAVDLIQIKGMREDFAAHLIYRLDVLRSIKSPERGNTEHRDMKICGEV